MTSPETTLTEWREAKLGEAARLTVRQPQAYSGVRPYLATADVDDGTVSPSEEFTFEKRPARAGLRLAKGDVIQAKMMATNKVFLVTDAEAGWLASTGFAMFCPGAAGSVPEYFYHWLQSDDFHRQKDRVCVGSTQKAISQTDLAAITIRAPDSQEQVRVAEFLDIVDRLRTNTEAVITKLKWIRTGLLRDFFTRGLDAQGKLRDPTLHPDQFRELALGYVPREWNVCLLDEVAVRGSGHTPNKDVPSYWDGGIKWVSLADSDKLDRIYISETDKQISELGVANSSAVIHPLGTVILSRDAGIGKSAILASEMAVSQHFMAWRCGKRLHNLYLYYWLQHNKRNFEAIAMGSTIKTIGLPYFKRLQIAVPTRVEQEAVSNKMLQVESAIDAAEKELSKQRMLKSGLMADLLTGRVRVPAGFEGNAAI